MKKILKICLLVFILISSLNAKDIYSQENITKHLETLFTKNIRYEKNNKYKRYIPFRNTIRFYYEFSPSIKNQKEKGEILKEVAKKFEKVINLKIELKHGKPDITLSEQNGKQKTTYNSEDSLYEEHIYFDFATRDEIFSKIKQGFWNKKFFLGKSSNIYKKYMEYIQRERELSIGTRRIETIKFKNFKGTVGIERDGKIERVPTTVQMDLIKLKNFHLLEVSKNRDKYFKEFVTKELLLSLLPNATKLNVSKYIEPSTINRRHDDYKKGEISWFDWIVLDEFYNNKELEKFMFYKTQVIPILTKSIYKRLEEETTNKSFQQKDICPYYNNNNLNILFGEFNIDEKDQIKIYEYLRNKGYIICGKEKLTQKETKFPIKKFLVNISQIGINIEKLDINKDGVTDYKIILNSIWFGMTGSSYILLENNNDSLIPILGDFIASDFILDDKLKSYPDVYITGRGLNVAKWIWNLKKSKYIFHSSNNENYNYILNLRKVEE